VNHFTDSRQFHILSLMSLIYINLLFFWYSYWYFDTFVSLLYLFPAHFEFLSLFQYHIFYLWTSVSDNKISYFVYVAGLELIEFLWTLFQYNVEYPFNEYDLFNEQKNDYSCSLLSSSTAVNILTPFIPFHPINLFISSKCIDCKGKSIEETNTTERTKCKREGGTKENNYMDDNMICKLEMAISSLSYVIQTFDRYNIIWLFDHL